MSLDTNTCTHLHTFINTYVYNIQVNCLIEEDELQEEIAYLKKLPPHPIALTSYNPRRSSLEANYFFQSPSLSLLMEWCASIGKLYGVPVSETYPVDRVYNVYAIHMLVVIF